MCPLLVANNDDVTDYTLVTIISVIAIVLLLMFILLIVAVLVIVLLLINNKHKNKAASQLETNAVRLASKIIFLLCNVFKLNFHAI